jgi:hypothetical protein
MGRFKERTVIMSLDNYDHVVRTVLTLLAIHVGVLVQPLAAKEPITGEEKQAAIYAGLAKHDATIRVAETKFSDWHLEHDSAAKSTRVGGVHQSKNRHISKQFRHSAYWKLSHTDRGTIILAQDGPYDGWYLSYRKADKDDSPPVVILQQSIGPDVFWSLSQEKNGFFIHPTVDEFAGFYLAFDPDGRSHSTPFGDFGPQVRLSDQSTIWHHQPNNDRAGRRHRPNVDQYLVTVGHRLDCHFTIEDHSGSSTFVTNVDFPDPAMATIEELTESLSKLFKNVEVVQSRKHPGVIHLIEKPIGKSPDYVLDKKVDLDFSGRVGDRLCMALGKLHPEIGPTQGGLLPGFGTDYVTKVELDVHQMPIRDVLTHGLPLEGYGRILWRATTSKNAGDDAPATTVRFSGPV